MSTTQGTVFFHSPRRLIALYVACYVAMLLILAGVGDRTRNEFLAVGAFFAICFALGAWRAIRRLPDRT